MTDPSPALRDGCGLCRTDLRQIVAVGGADARPWLERLLSLPVADVAAPACVSCTLMDGKGRMRADVAVLLGEQELLLDLPAEPTLLRTLDMFVIQDDVQLAPCDERVQLTLAGPGTDAVLKALGAGAAAAGQLRTTPEGWTVHRSRVLGQALGLPRDALSGALERLEAAGAVPVTLEQLDLARIAAGRPRWPDDLADGVIPLEAGLDEDVSTTKGCYPGQEVVARIRNLGQVSRKLVRLGSDGPADASPGDELLGTGDHAGKTAGTLRSLAYDAAADRSLALGYLRRAFWDAGCQVSGGERTWTVLS